MIPRPALIAALVLIEVAIAGEGILAVRGDSHLPPSSSGVSAQGRAAAGADNRSGAQVVEGAPYVRFDVEARSTLDIDIGNADLTITTGAPNRLDVSLTKSTSLRPFQATGAIVARRDGATIRIGLEDRARWSTGDDRRLTVVIPPAMRITVVRAGDINASGLRADAAFDSQNGDVTVEHSALPALHVQARNGRIMLLEIASRRLDVRSNQGRIEGIALQVRDGSIESGDGRISLAFTADANTLVTAQSSNGSIRVAGVSEPAAPSRLLRLGAGSGRLGVQSNDGDIVLVR